MTRTSALLGTFWEIRRPSWSLYSYTAKDIEDIAATDGCLRLHTTFSALHLLAKHQWMRCFQMHMSYGRT